MLSAGSNKLMSSHYLRPASDQSKQFNGEMFKV